LSSPMSMFDIYIQNNRSASAVSSWICDELKKFDLSTEKMDEINTNGFCPIWL